MVTAAPDLIVEPLGIFQKRFLFAGALLMARIAGDAQRPSRQNQVEGFLDTFQGGRAAGRGGFIATGQIAKIIDDQFDAGRGDFRRKLRVAARR